MSMDCTGCGAIVVQGGVHGPGGSYYCRPCAEELARKRLPHASEEEKKQIYKVFKNLAKDDSACDKCGRTNK